MNIRNIIFIKNIKKKIEFFYMHIYLFCAKKKYFEKKMVFLSNKQRILTLPHRIELNLYFPSSTINEQMLKTLSSLSISTIRTILKSIFIVLVVPVDRITLERHTLCLPFKMHRRPVTWSMCSRKQIR